MSNYFDRLQFLLINNNLSYISEKSGIPYSTLYSFKTEKRDLPIKWYSSFQTLYRREVYSTYRDIGASVKEATNWRGHQPDQILYDIKKTQEKIDFLTTGSAIKKLIASGEKYDQETFWKIYDSLRPLMEKAFYDSKKDLETKWDY